MITEALLHCSGIGPARLKQLHGLGIRSWIDVIQNADQLPDCLHDSLLEESMLCQAALEDRNIRFFVERFHPTDKWRILNEFLDDVSVFDIETDGLDYDSRITMIAVWHRGAVHSFVEHENLDDFLLLLDEVKLLASFNGSSFDVPRILDGFHIPALPCPHLDLRWLSYHHGFQGGLKEIASREGITRPTDLMDADGELAIRLWSRWECFEDRGARDLLVRYCCSDVLLSYVLAHQLAGAPTEINVNALWSQLPTCETGPKPHLPESQAPVVGEFGEGSPMRLRARRGR